MNVGEIVFKAVLGVCSLSLAVNSWLIQNRVADITESIKELNSRMATVQIQGAELGRDVSMHERVLTNQAERLQNVEATVNKLNGYIGRR